MKQPHEESEWLVAICLKNWIPSFKDTNRTVCYEEVLARNEYEARHAGFDQFVQRVQHVPTLRRKLHAHGISTKECCAPEAVCLE